MEEEIASVNKNTDKHFITGTSVLPALTSPVKKANNVTVKDDTRRVNATSTSETITWTDNASFIKAIAPSAQKLADQYGLYPSVMIAQAALESGFGASKLSKEANNLFGIKFSSGDEGKFEKYDIPSDEFINGIRVTLPASFRKYATISDSLLDNAKLLANGLSWNAKFYQGTWRKNARTYQEATQSLTGKYATDPNYHTKLNQLIVTWDLTKYD
jgi:flagellum-specific peptidoglycan hydrolase FlgJ